MLEKFTLLKIAVCKAPASRNASLLRTSSPTSRLPDDVVVGKRGIVDFRGHVLLLRPQVPPQRRVLPGVRREIVRSSAAWKRGTVEGFAKVIVGPVPQSSLGYDPETVDFSDPALPPGMTAEKVHAGIAVAMKQFAERGWEADVCFIRPDETAGPTVERQLGSTSYDCVVIGAGVRLPPRGLALFEAVINAIHKAAPGAAIAFNTRPDDSADAAARGLALGSRAV